MTTPTKHASGRIHRNGLSLFNDDFQMIAGSESDDYLECNPDEQKANLDRLAACWNVFDGIADPTDLRKQRDELLEALKGFVMNGKYLRTEEPFVGALERLLQMAEDTIARAEGRSS